jgi:hypothetical protein
MWEKTAGNVGISLMIIAGLILYLVQKEAGSLQLFDFLSLGVILVLCLVLPVVGIVLAVPIAFIVYFKNSTTVWAFIDQYKNSTIK